MSSDHYQATVGMRDFWDQPTIEEAMNKRVSLPVQDWGDSVFLRRVAANIIDRLNLKAQDRICDFGAGVGRVSRELVRLGFLVAAVDVSNKMLGYCRERCGEVNIDYYLSDGFGCGNLEDNSCQAAISFSVFQHIQTMEAVLACLKDLDRVVVPGGKIRIQTCDGRRMPPDGRFVGVNQPEHDLIRAAIDLGWTALTVDRPFKDNGRYVATWSTANEKSRHRGGRLT